MTVAIKIARVELLKSLLKSQIRIPWECKERLKVLF